MKLISCYVENFGGLSGYSIEFEDSLTIIKEDNGFGKTTLAAFIKAMFYGFPRATKSLEKNERKLYTPWQGGSFGGNLVFEHEGIRYRIERFFGATPKQDKFVLYELEPFCESKRFSENIGVELFKLDVESYEKSTYMTQAGSSDAFATAGIQTKLGDLVEESNDIYNFDKAVSALKDKRSTYKNYRGQAGSIYEKKERISSLQGKMATKPLLENEHKELVDSLSQLNARLKDNENRLEETRKRISSVSETTVIANLNQQLDELVKEKTQLANEFDAILAKYPQGLPKKEELDMVTKAADSVSRMDSAINALFVSSEDRLIYEENYQLFKDGVPTDEYINKLQTLVNRVGDLKEKINAKKNEVIVGKTSANGGAKIVLIVISIILFISGVVAIATENVTPAIVLFVAGAAFAISTFFTNKTKKVHEDTEFVGLESEAKELENSICQELGKYFIGKQIAANEFSDYVYELKNKCNLYRLAEKNIVTYEQSKAIYEQDRKKAEVIVENFLKSNGIVENPDFEKIKEDIVKGEALRIRLEQKETQIENFRNENKESLKAYVPENVEDINKLKIEERLILSENHDTNAEIIRTKQAIFQKERELEAFPLMEDELQEVMRAYEEDKKACEILDETIAFLTQARDNINLSYVRPVKDRFDMYVNNLLGEKKLQVFMDKELQVKPEQYGEARELTYFSAGYTDIVRLCMHLALVDVLFENGDCFILLDDPFINLDDKNAKEAIRMLKDLSQEKQIIYLVCHSSRM